MAAATANRDGQRQPGELLHFSGASGYKYYKNTLMIKDGTDSPVIRPLTQAGSSMGYFLGVNEDAVDLTAGLGSSQAILRIWSKGEFTFSANGTGASAHIGQRAYALDDQTVGVSMAVHSLWVGMITGIPTTTSYRVLIDPAINSRGVSHDVNNV